MQILLSFRQVLLKIAIVDSKIFSIIGTASIYFIHFTEEFEQLHHLKHVEFADLALNKLYNFYIKIF